MRSARSNRPRLSRPAPPSAGQGDWGRVCKPLPVSPPAEEVYTGPFCHIGDNLGPGLGGTSWPAVQGSSES
jgi:hypothetical protein